MALTVSESSNYVPAPQGTHVARCTRLIDLGPQETPFSDSPKPQIWLQFELVDEPIDDTQNHVVSRFYNLTLNKQSALRTDLEGWCGRSFTPAELKSFDLSSMVDIPCQVVVGHREKDSVVRAEIRSLSALPKGVHAAPAKSETLIFDMDTRDEAVLAELPDWLVDIIHRAEEWQAPKPGKKPEPSDGGGNDDVPW